MVGEKPTTLPPNATTTRHLSHGKGGFERVDGKHLFAALGLSDGLQDAGCLNNNCYIGNEMASANTMSVRMAVIYACCGVLALKAESSPVLASFSSMASSFSFTVGIRSSSYIFLKGVVRERGCLRGRGKPVMWSTPPPPPPPTPGKLHQLIENAPQNELLGVRR